MLKYLRDRKRMGYLVGSFLLVLVIFAFVVFYIPDFFEPAGGAGFIGEIARVEGIPISGQQFQQRYRLQEQVYRAQLGQQYSPALMRQLGLEDLVLRGLIQDALLVVEAQRQGLTVSDEELAGRIVRDPTFQSNGQFIGRSAYLQTLSQNGWKAGQFETELRDQILRQKLQTLVTDGVLVSSGEVEREYRNRNEMAKLEYVYVPKEPIDESKVVTDEEISAYFEENKEQYRLPLQRKIRYLPITSQPFQASVTVTEREIERDYNQNLHLYETPQQVRASHILFKSADKDEEEVQRQAEAVLAQVKSGGDFAALARKHSEDTSAEQGGDLGFFGRGEMVPEFEQAAFSLSIGDTSELVKSTYGFHIIKVTEKQEPLTRPLDSVRDEIRGGLIQKDAVDLMGKAVTQASEYLRSTENLEGLAQQYDLLTTKETDFFGRQDAVPQLGGSQELRSLVFELPIGEVSPPLRQGQDYVFFEVLEEREAHIPPFEDVREQVKTDLLDKAAMTAARTKAEEIRLKLKEARAAADAAKAVGTELKTAESFYRGTQLPEAGRSPAVQDAAFAGETGTFSAPLPSRDGFVVLRVVERTGYDPEKFASEKDTFTEQVLAQKRQQFWAAYMQALQQRSSVEVNRDTLRGLTG
jgi:peptidyl-prolyl cis-trans isomerase D